MLPANARIAVVSPSGPVDLERLARGEELLRGWGLQMERMPGMAGNAGSGARWRYLAGDDTTRGADLLRAFSGDYDAVWMARGGYGLARLLRSIPFEDLAPVPLFGFSDGTALLTALAIAGRPAVHAPVLTHLGDTADDASRAHLRALLQGELRTLPVRASSGAPNGTLEAPLLGGNLSVLASLCGTPWQLDARGAVVVLEDIGEAPYRIDRLLRQMLDSGALDEAAAVVLGEFTGTSIPADANWDVEAIASEVLEEYGIPLYVDAPVGHGARNHAFPLGVRCTLDTHGLRVATAR
jgi:muramoyltetrapeptide carboxypeptidase